ncbi:hypothetical protein ACJIZ3_011181 [Penstemon smallii]|uniref:Uncharacterized protein n=1 Tax=Penstemon smallii TaxID=265156 RepID=A0ABD3UIE2_9LAMI
MCVRYKKKVIIFTMARLVHVKNLIQDRGIVLQESKLREYMLFFLKFTISVILTIEYDYTMAFDLGSSVS